MQMILQYFMAHIQIVGLIGFVLFSGVRLKSYLHIFQQDEYDNLRFLKWIVKTGSVDRTATVFILLVWLCGLGLPSVPGFVLVLITAVIFVALSLRERKHQSGAKKPLVMTSRATRTFQIAWAAVLALTIALIAWRNSPLIWLLAVHSCPIALIVANLVLLPIENQVKARYWREAHEKLTKLAPLIIAITGSFGKTSVKHILGHLLQFHAPTLITPGSVNTAMGISRVVREQLRPSHKFFIAEMGAYGPGSIEALCRLAPPKLGILTTIGAAHLERFGSREITAQAKMELSTAVLSNGGKMIINADVTSLSAVVGQLALKRSSFVTCGDAAGDVAYSNVSQSSDGLSFIISCLGRTHHVFVPLFGRHQALNVTLAFAAAHELGMSAEDIIIALKTAPQISHRLEVRKQSNGALFIDDAYNSNPTGFASALELVGSLKRDNGKAILITPGMVELGSEHAAEHFRLGQMTAKVADIVFVVAGDRIPTFLDGLRSDPGSKCQIEMFDTFQEAHAKLMMNIGANDIVLIENDLPDLYERKVVL